LTLFLRHPRTPISTLSPYTTLFRSNNLGEARTEHKALCLPSWVQLYRRRAPHFGPHRTVIDSLSLAFRPVHSGNRREGIRPNGQDRKSTRLNSSHVSISYAVFCLKK